MDGGDHIVDAPEVRGRQVEGPHFVGRKPPDPLTLSRIRLQGAPPDDVEAYGDGAVLHDGSESGRGVEWEEDVDANLLTEFATEGLHGRPVRGLDFPTGAVPCERIFVRCRALREEHATIPNEDPTDDLDRHHDPPQRLRRSSSMASATRAHTSKSCVWYRRRAAMKYASHAAHSLASRSA